MLVSRAMLSLVCLREAGLEAYDLNALVFYEKPPLKFERSLETYLYSAPMLV
jgi:carbamoyltransferase